MAGPTIQLAGGCGRRIGGLQPCLIVAEIGQNHQGDVQIAKRMINMAKVSGTRPRCALRSHLGAAFVSHYLGDGNARCRLFAILVPHPPLLGLVPPA